MRTRDWVILIFFTIITCGILPLVLFLKNHQTKPQTSLTQVTKIKLDLTWLINKLGGIDNLVGAEYTHTKVKVLIRDYQRVDHEALMKQKAISGIASTSKSITLIVGKSAKTLATKLFAMIKT